MSSFWIKIIAIVSMLLDHSGDALIGHVTPLNFIGRIAFPLFCFQLVVGYAHTSNVLNYCKRLFIFALVSQIPFGIMIYNYTHELYSLNVFFTLLLGVFVMIIFDSKKLPFIVKSLFILCILLIAHFINVDYQAMGVLMILVIHIFYKLGIFNSKEIDITSNVSPKIKKYAPFLFILSMLAFSILRFMPTINSFPNNYTIIFILCTFAPTFVMLLYNGKKGPSLKYFFYIFYPAHLIVLDILHYFI